ncbi:MAG: hypothetical protein WBQ29_22630, partial [Isosphaeraceae bacterium]
LASIADPKVPSLVLVMFMFPPPARRNHEEFVQTMSASPPGARQGPEQQADAARQLVPGPPRMAK